VLRRVGHADVADLVADVFTAVWRRIEDVPPPPEDKLWLYGVARRVVSQHERGKRRRERFFLRLRHHDRSAEQPISEDDSLLQSQVVDLLNPLKPNDRELVRLVIWEQLTHAEIAQILGCSANAVAIRWHRSLERLRRELGSQRDLPATPMKHEFRSPRTEGL